MKVVCINNIYEGRFLDITVGKTYHALEETWVVYYITDDSGNCLDYNRRRFVTVDEWRDRQIREVLG